MSTLLKNEKMRIWTTIKILVAVDADDYNIKVEAEFNHISRLSSVLPIYVVFLLVST